MQEHQNALRELQAELQEAMDNEEANY